MVARQKLRHFNLSGYLEARSQRFLGALAALLILIVVILDWVTGPDISTSIFFLLPIALGSWYMNRRAGLALALIGAGAWLAIDLLTNSALRSPLIPFWNAGVRLGFFIVVVIALASLRTSRQRQDDLLTFVVHDIRSPLGNMLTALELLEQSVGGPEATVRFAIADQGPGIPAKWQSQVFAKYRQVGRQKGRVAGGSGLGLTFCQQAVLAQNGRIWLESDGEAGTVMHFTLPAGAP